MVKESNVFTSQRLNYRPFENNDFEFFYQLFTNKNVMEFISPYGKIKNDDQIQQSFQNRVQHWKENGYGFFLLQDKNGNKIGYCGFRLWKPENEIELGYILDQPYWGRGYASEAVQACLTWGARNLSTTELVAVTAKRNIASQKILSKHGFDRKPTRDGDYHGEPAIFWVYPNYCSPKSK